MLEQVIVARTLDVVLMVCSYFLFVQGLHCYQNQ
jgi:hypothetical protein